VQGCLISNILIHAACILYTFSITGVEKATEALELINGYVLRKKPRILQYGHTSSSKRKMVADLQS
jgi:hypothetical protein